jgi:hypothetical protein
MQTHMLPMSSASQRRYERERDHNRGRDDGRGGFDREPSSRTAGLPQGGVAMHSMPATGPSPSPGGGPHLGGPMGVPVGTPPGQWAVPQPFVPGGQPFMQMVPGERSALRQFMPFAHQRRNCMI